MIGASATTRSRSIEGARERTTRRRSIDGALAVAVMTATDAERAVTRGGVSSDAIAPPGAPAVDSTVSGWAVLMVGPMREGTLGASEGLNATLAKTEFCGNYHCA